MNRISTSYRDWQNLKHKRIFITFLIASFIVAAFWVRMVIADYAPPTEYAQAVKLEPDGGAANCRYGTSPLSNLQTSWVAPLGAGFFLNFTADSEGTPANDATFYHVVRVSQDKDSSGNYLSSYTTSPQINSNKFNNLIDNNPGAIWIVGNEADRGPNPGETEIDQDDTFPDMYATIYHDVYYYIKGRDPTAKIMNTSLVQVTPGRLQYLDIVWDSYLAKYGHPMPVDIWNFHVYILPEANPQGQPNAIANVALGTDPSIAIRESGGNSNLCSSDDVYCYAEHDDMDVFTGQVRAMRTWMKEHGEQHKPLVLTEYSILYPYVDEGGGNCFLRDEFGNCFTPDRVEDYMLNTFNYLETAKDPNLGYPLDDGRLVQQWLWFSVKSFGVGFVSDLVNDDLTGLTPLGQIYQNRVLSKPVTRNLLVESVGTPTVNDGGSGMVDAEISVTFRNNGNHEITSPFTVTFRDSSNAIIDQVTVNDSLLGCAAYALEVSTIWEDRPPGKHDYTVTLDSGSVISEPSEGDNVGSGFVLVNPNEIHLPLINR